MRWTYTLGRVGETEIKLHLTFFLLLAYWAAEATRPAECPARSARWRC